MDHKQLMSLMPIPRDALNDWDLPYEIYFKPFRNTIVDNVHWGDLDSLRMMQDLLSTKTLQNFLLIGCHEAVHSDHPLEESGILLLSLLEVSKQDGSTGSSWVVGCGSGSIRRLLPHQLTHRDG
jgi:hypothetical protein